jgi:hypothetical protein
MKKQANQPISNQARGMSIAFLGLCLLLQLGCSAEKPIVEKEAIGAVLQTHYRFRYERVYTQVDTANRNILVEGYAPLIKSTAVELRGPKGESTLLCISGTTTCWPIHN